MPLRSLNAVARLVVAAIVATTAVALADDAPPDASYEQALRIVHFPHQQGAPVRIGYGYVALFTRTKGPHDAEMASCLRFFNVGSQATAGISFRRTYYDAHHRLLGIDTVQDGATRAPDPSDMNASGSMAGYWRCWKSDNRYGGRVVSVDIVPTWVKLTSGKVWAESGNVGQAGG